MICGWRHRHVSFLPGPDGRSDDRIRADLIQDRRDFCNFNARFFGKGACGNPPAPVFEAERPEDFRAGALCYGAGNVRYEEVTGDG